MASKNKKTDKKDQKQRVKAAIKLKEQKELLAIKVKSEKEKKTSKEVPVSKAQIKQIRVEVKDQLHDQVDIALQKEVQPHLNNFQQQQRSIEEQLSSLEDILISQSKHTEHLEGYAAEVSKRFEEIEQRARQLEGAELRFSADDQELFQRTKELETLVSELQQLDSKIQDYVDEQSQQGERIASQLEQLRSNQDAIESKNSELEGSIRVGYQENSSLKEQLQQNHQQMDEDLQQLRSMLNELQVLHRQEGDEVKLQLSALISDEKQLGESVAESLKKNNQQLILFKEDLQSELEKQVGLARKQIQEGIDRQQQELERLIELQQSSVDSDVLKEELGRQKQLFDDFRGEVAQKISPIQQGLDEQQQQFEIFSSQQLNQSQHTEHLEEFAAGVSKRFEEIEQRARQLEGAELRFSADDQELMQRTKHLESLVSELQQLDSQVQTYVLEQSQQAESLHGQLVVTDSLKGELDLQKQSFDDFREQLVQQISPIQQGLDQQRQQSETLLNELKNQEQALLEKLGGKISAQQEIQSAQKSQLAQLAVDISRQKQLLDQLPSIQQAIVNQRQQFESFSSQQLSDISEQYNKNQLFSDRLQLQTEKITALRDEQKTLVEARVEQSDNLKGLRADIDKGSVVTAGLHQDIIALQHQHEAMNDWLKNLHEYDVKNDKNLLKFEKDLNSYVSSQLDALEGVKQWGDELNIELDVLRGQREEDYAHLKKLSQESENHGQDSHEIRQDLDQINLDIAATTADAEDLKEMDQRQGYLLEEIQRREKDLQSSLDESRDKIKHLSNCSEGQQQQINRLEQGNLQQDDDHLNLVQAVGGIDQRLTVLNDDTVRQNRFNDHTNKEMTHRVSRLQNAIIGVGALAAILVGVIASQKFLDSTFSQRLAKEDQQHQVLAQFNQRLQAMEYLLDTFPRQEGSDDNVESITVLDLQLGEIRQILEGIKEEQAGLDDLKLNQQNQQAHLEVIDGQLHRLELQIPDLSKDLPLKLDQNGLFPLQRADINEGRWVEAQPGKNYSIQLLGVYNASGVDLFVGQHREQLDLKNLARYQRNNRGRSWHLLLMGSYSQFTDAQKALDELPSAVKTFNPWIRPFASIHAPK